MTNGALALLRKLWASLMAWEAAMDYSAADYTNDRIGGLEREVEQLKDELSRAAAAAGRYAGADRAGGEAGSVSPRLCSQPGPEQKCGSRWGPLSSAACSASPASD